VQVNIAMVVTCEGMPLGYEIFSGNTVDVTTVEEIVATMERRFGKANRIWAMDRVMVTLVEVAATRRDFYSGTYPDLAILGHDRISSSICSAALSRVRVCSSRRSGLVVC
jgi:hypothetical protein